VLLGEGRVGKSSIILRFMHNKYDDRQQSTLSASCFDKLINLGGSESARISLWDTAGQERFHALGPLYYRDADGALLVYDITDEQSFRRVQDWVKELRKMLGEDIVIAIAGAWAFFFVPHVFFFRRRRVEPPTPPSLIPPFASPPPPPPLPHMHLTTPPGI
jgi:hypothetical protein